MGMKNKTYKKQMRSLMLEEQRCKNKLLRLKFDRKYREYKLGGL